MPKMGPGKGKSRGMTRLTRAFNDASADPTKSFAFDSNAFSSNAYEGDAQIGTHSTSYTSTWSGR